MEQFSCLMICMVLVIALAAGMPHPGTSAGTLSSLGGDGHQNNGILPDYNMTTACGLSEADSCEDNATTSTSSSTDKDAHPEGCKCVAFYLCDDNNTIIEDGHGFLDMRSKREVCGSYLEKCCMLANIRPQPISMEVFSPTPPPLGPKPTSNSCGIRNINGIGFQRDRRQLHGTKFSSAQYGEFPWMAALLRRSNDTKIYQCGGSLIHPQVVLTAAQCVKSKKDLFIRAGEYDTTSNSEQFPTQDLNVRESIIHEQFNSLTLTNDIALLILEDNVNMTFPNVGLICLPQEDENMDGRECVTSGWGKDKFGKAGKYQDTLKKVDVPIVQRNVCLEALRNARLGEYFKLHPSFICAGGKQGMDTCKGDGGSPLVCPSEGDGKSYVQAGIVAWGIGCGTETPGVYVNVPAFVTWIKNQLEQRNITL